ncbi:MAG TPA: rod shape-determining protein RodA [Elusimicrobiota bacterium]|nr:rod shape-determining protein RodA [Elusimicrobiota bacterium]
MTLAIYPKRVEEESWLKRVLRRVDWTLLGVMLMLIGLGVVFIYSATAPSGHSGDYLIRQGLAAAAGILLVLLLSILPYQVLRTYSYGIYFLSVLLLLAVLLFGTRLRGTRAWLNFYWFYFQPVELTKLLLAVGLAGYVDRSLFDLGRWQGLFTPFLMLGIHLGLILLQPDFSSTLVLFPMAFILLYTAGARVNHLLAVGALGALSLGIPLVSTYLKFSEFRAEGHMVRLWIQQAFVETNAPFFQFWLGLCLLLVVGWWFLRQWRIVIPAFYLVSTLMVVVVGVSGSFMVKSVLKEYQRKRLIAFVNPTLDPQGAGYNILQSEIAIGSGRLFGKGYLSGSQAQLGFLPERHTDFVFSLIAEEGGFFLALIVLGLYFWIVWRAFDIAYMSRDRFGRWLAISIGSLFAVSGLVNVGMVMGLMPVTGLPLPFVSYGGSSLVGACAGIGILMSIHLRRYVL